MTFTIDYFSKCGIRMRSDGVRVLAVGADEREQARLALERAAKRPLSYEEVRAFSRTPRPLPFLRRPSERVAFPVGFRALVDYEHHASGLFLHLGIVSEHLFAVAPIWVVSVIASTFGMDLTDAVATWIEPGPWGRDAVNVLQLIASKEGHA